MSLQRAPILKHGKTTWDKDLIPQREVDERVARIRAAMKARGYDALLVVGDSLRGGNSIYVTNFAPWEPRAIAAAIVTPSAHEATLQIALRNIPFVQPYVWAKVRTAADEGVGSAVEEAATELQLKHARIAFVGGRFLGEAMLGQIQKTFAGGKLTEADDIILELRRRKSPTEIALVRGAGAKAEKILADIIQHAEPGMTEAALAAYADYAFRRSGCQDVDVLFRAGEAGIEAYAHGKHFPFRPASSQPLSAAPSTGIYIAVQYHGYWLELSQSFVVAGKAPIAALDTAFAEMLKAARPGGSVGKSDARAAWIHGIGLDREEAPQFLPGGEALEAGDTIAAHVAIRQGDDVLVKGRVALVGEAGSTVLA